MMGAGIIPAAPTFVRIGAIDVQRGGAVHSISQFRARPAPEASVEASLLPSTLARAADLNPVFHEAHNG